MTTEEQTHNPIPLLNPIKRKPGCGICGGKVVWIRGRYPKQPKRKVCPTCVCERLEQINEISSKSYGQAYQSKQ